MQCKLKKSSFTQLDVKSQQFMESFMIMGLMDTTSAQFLNAMRRNALSYSKNADGPMQHSYN
jgi:hypothetical protein